MSAIKSEPFIADETLAKMRQAEKDHPATDHASAGGWCRHCGCGNDVLNYKHLPNCNRPLTDKR